MTAFPVALATLFQIRHRVAPAAKQAIDPERLQMMIDGSAGAHRLVEAGRRDTANVGPPSEVVRDLDAVPGREGRVQRHA